MNTTLSFNKQHPACEGIDRIEITCVERWKTSELSGDEWRFSYVVRGYFKGVVVLEYSRNRLREAAAHLPFEIDRGRDDGAAKQWQERREISCDPPGCPAEPTRWLELTDEYSRQGEGPLPQTVGIHHYRKFCEAHKDRGDCAREDADANYIEIANPRNGGGDA
jgi:hypothetical protein